GPTLDDRLHVVAGDRLVTLEGVGDRQHLTAVRLQQRLGPLQQATQVALDPGPERAFEQLLVVAFISLAGPSAAADADPLRDAVRGDRRAHAPVTLHEGGDGRCRLEVAGHARRAVAGEEETL